MFGNGVYLASTASKSAQYVSSQHGTKTLLLCDAAVGTMYEAPEAQSSILQAPIGFDSVLGRAGKTRSWGGTLQFDEHILYQADQQTIKYLITWE
jgi:hypothetical protein